MDWSSLPVDLLVPILEQLPVADRIRFGCVCSSWRSAAAHADPNSPTPQSPWLMLPSAPPTASFFSLPEQKVYKIPQPAGRPHLTGDCLRVGSSHGWLVDADAASELHLFNPVTGAQIPLPSITTFPFVAAVRDSEGHATRYNLCFEDGIPLESFGADQLRYFLYEKAVLSAKPALSSSSSSSSSPSPCSQPIWGGYTVMLIHNPLFRLAFARAGDKAWTVIDTYSSYWVDAICSSSGHFYTLESKGRVEDWDLDGPLPSSSVIAPSSGAYSDCSKYLVEVTPGNQLLQVRRWKTPAHTLYKWEPRLQYVEYTTTKVEVFKLARGDTISGRRSSWIQQDKESFHGFALFLGKNASLCLSVRECPALRGNCIYFTDDACWSFERCHDVAQDVAVFDLANGSIKPFVVYGFQTVWPPPIWFTPSMY